MISTLIFKITLTVFIVLLAPSIIIILSRLNDIIGYWSLLPLICIISGAVLFVMCVIELLGSIWGFNFKLL